MTLNEFRMWSELSLKNYLSLRKQTNGDFETLVYRYIKYPVYVLHPLFTK